MLESDELERVRRTWALAAADPQRTAQAFYATLFRVDPSTKPLFVGDIELQGRKLAHTLAFVVDHLDHADVLVPAAQELALRHVEYEVQEAQYASVGAALIQTFQKLLGAQFSALDAAAWEKAYGLLSGVMCDAAYRAS